ncbi:MAG: putative metal-dependent hydrolase [Bacteroidetes bacterium]|nr:putative metal-dependent hydrolase [Bacteroidota bacterium]
MNDREKYILEIKNLPKNLREVVNGLSVEQLDTPYGEGKWTPRQVVHHLADSHMHSYIRMKFVLSENHPTIKPYNQEVWAKFVDANNSSVEVSLSILDGLHERWSNLLSTLKDDDWAKTAFHPESGEITLDWMLKYYQNHGNNHIGQIKKLRDSKGW